MCGATADGYIIGATDGLRRSRRPYPKARTGDFDNVRHKGLSARWRLAGDRRLSRLLEPRAGRRATLSLLRGIGGAQGRPLHVRHRLRFRPCDAGIAVREADPGQGTDHSGTRSEEHTSELQSLRHLVCRLLLEKKNKI